MIPYAPEENRSLSSASCSTTLDPEWFTLLNDPGMRGGKTYSSYCTPPIYHPFLCLQKNSVSHSQHLCASWTEQVMGYDEFPTSSITFKLTIIYACRL